MSSHKLLRFRLIYVANYDKLIEKALENNGKICDIKTCCANLTTTLKGRNVVVYKMHGDKSNPDEAILINKDISF